MIDIACGTGIVTGLLARPDRRVLGFDRSAGMLGLAAERLPNRVAVGDAMGLPVGRDRVDAVVLIWLLHLLDDAAPVIAETARVLRPGGVFITTVDKDAAALDADTEIAEILAPIRRYAPAASDGRSGSPIWQRVTVCGRSTRRPRRIRAGSQRAPVARDADHRSVHMDRCRRPASLADICGELASLPDQDAANDPVYRLVALA